MPGAFGKTNSDDGLHASTRSNAKSGVFGRNEAKKSRPPTARAAPASSA